MLNMSGSLPTHICHIEQGEERYYLFINYDQAVMLHDALADKTDNTEIVLRGRDNGRTVSITLRPCDITYYSCDELKEEQRA
jgi:hypothetical protein